MTLEHTGRGLKLTGLVELHNETSTNAYTSRAPSSTMPDMRQGAPPAADGCTKAAHVVNVVVVATWVPRHTSSAL
jgi:hypothetical protein